jgi:hypothetical protein
MLEAEIQCLCDLLAEMCTVVGDLTVKTINQLQCDDKKPSKAQKSTGHVSNSILFKVRPWSHMVTTILPYPTLPLLDKEEYTLLKAPCPELGPPNPSGAGPT